MLSLVLDMYVCENISRHIYGLKAYEMIGFSDGLMTSWVLVLTINGHGYLKNICYFR